MQMEATMDVIPQNKPTLWDKNAVMQIFGSLIKKTEILSRTDKYSLAPDGFDSLFEKAIFSAISNLYFSGVTSVSIVDIDTYLASFPTAYQIFNDGRGIEYLQDAVELSNPDNFEYYYNRIQKFNCLRGLHLAGVNTQKFYNENRFDETAEDTNTKFDKMTVKDILTSIKKDIISIESRFDIKDGTRVQKASEGVKDLVLKLKVEPEIGAPLQGDIFNTIVRGARQGKFYIRSASSGTGKTRTLVGDACKVAYPIRFDWSSRKWVMQGVGSTALFVATEQGEDEIQTLIISYLSGVNEEKILFGKYTEEEEKVVMEACEVMDAYQNNLIIAQISDPDIEQIKAVVRKAYVDYDLTSVFYDYIFSSPSLLGQFRDLRIREDVALMMLSTSLKDLAVELNVFMFSATQVNREAENKKGIKDNTVIQGSMAIVNKADIGCVISTVTSEDKEFLSQVYSIDDMPNMKTDIYKVRRGRWKNTRIWSKFDLGTCRGEDFFITDSEGEVVMDFSILDPVYDMGKITEVDTILEKMNEGRKFKKEEIIAEEQEQKDEDQAPWMGEERFPAKKEEDEDEFDFRLMDKSKEKKKKPEGIVFDI